MSLTRLELAKTLVILQTNANLCARLFASYPLKIEYLVVYTTGVRYPWRLLELHHDKTRDGEPWVKRRMHCFDTAEKLGRSVRERTQWKAKDRALVAIHLSATRATLRKRLQPDNDEMARVALDRLNAELAELEPQRRALRERICLTQADHVSDLLRGQTAARPWHK